MKDPKIILLSKHRQSAWQRGLASTTASLRSIRHPAPWIVVAVFFGALALVAYNFSGDTGQWNKASPIGPSELFNDGIATCGWIRRTCLVDGDTGWQDHRKWRLKSIDAPELGNAECAREREVAERSLARLVELMSSGYRVVWSGKDDRYGRALVSITLEDARDVGAVLQAEGLAQPWPNTGNVWCEG